MPTFVRRAYAALESISARDLRGRSGTGVKALVEEVLPLSVFLKHLERPSRDVRCRLAAANSDHDARVRVHGPEVDRGFMLPSYFIEITTAASPLDYLQRESLNENGYVFGGTDIRVEGSRKKGTRRVVSSAMAIDGEAGATDTTTWVRAAIELKARKIYRAPCILLVNVEPAKPLTPREWGQLVTDVHHAASSSRFKAVYLADWNAGVVVPAHAG